MSQQNVEIARRNNEAFRRADWEALTASLDPHVLLRTDPRWPEQYVYGQAAAIDFYRSGWESLGPDARIEEIEDLGDRLLIRLRWVTRGRQSGLETDLRWSEVVTYRDGRSVFIEYFLDHEQARKAVGLEE
jgi:ketosteroid isomerase-like protein